MPVTEETKHWLACVVDTEGCISTTKKSLRVSFSIGMTSRRFIEEFLERAELKAKITSYKRKGTNADKCKMQFSTRISKNVTLLNFLVMVEPLLVSKGPRARAAIAYLQHRQAKRNQAFDELDREFYERILHARDL